MNTTGTPHGLSGLIGRLRDAAAPSRWVGAISRLKSKVASHALFRDPARVQALVQARNASRISQALCPSLGPSSGVLDTGGSSSRVVVTRLAVGLRMPAARALGKSLNRAWKAAPESVLHPLKGGGGFMWREDARRGRHRLLLCRPASDAALAGATGHEGIELEFDPSRSSLLSVWQRAGRGPTDLLHHAVRSGWLLPGVADEVDLRRRDPLDRLDWLRNGRLDGHKVHALRAGETATAQAPAPVLRASCDRSGLILAAVVRDAHGRTIRAGMALLDRPMPASGLARWLTSLQRTSGGGHCAVSLISGSADIARGALAAARLANATAEFVHVDANHARVDTLVLHQDGGLAHGADGHGPGAGQRPLLSLPRLADADAPRRVAVEVAAGAEVLSRGHDEGRPFRALADPRSVVVVATARWRKDASAQVVGVAHWHAATACAEMPPFFARIREAGAWYGRAPEVSIVQGRRAAPVAEAAADAAWRAGLQPQRFGAPFDAFEVWVDDSGHASLVTRDASRLSPPPQPPDSGSWLRRRMD